jgi:hypothetical protein
VIAGGIGVGRAPEVHATTAVDAIAAITTNGAWRPPEMRWCDGSDVMDAR